MSGHNRPAAANRTLLALLGLVLLAAGAFTLLTAYGVVHWIPKAHTVFPAGRQLTNWAPYAVVAAAVVLGLLCLRWLAAQGRKRPRTSSWQLADDPDTGVTVLSSATAVQPLADEVSEYPGVHAAGAWLSGHSGEPRLLLRVRTEHDTNLAALRQEITDEALPRLCQALDLTELDATIQFEPTAPASRIR
jgi:hypothetical protein